MSHSFPVIGIIGKRDHPSVGATVAQLATLLDGHARQVIMDQRTAGLLPQWTGNTADQTELGQRCDLLIVVGGDGALLNAGRMVAPFGTPLLGVNLGRLGFMVDVLPDHMEDTLDQVLAGSYVRDERLMLSAWVQRRGDAPIGPYPALNEVTVRNAEFARVLEFDTHLEHGFISRHRADGIIIASPTGSTAYALSGGGPVLHPGMDALVIVPICPHTLSDRPLVIDAHHRVGITICDGDHSQALFTADGQDTETLGPGDQVFVERAQTPLTLIHPPGYDYFNILRNKLRWGRGQLKPDAPC
ncbi:MAG: NAD(+) kinase [Salinisphaera sp.]|nr:NAD(+) kinase [Salinisphaera sp.]MDN5937313.1 NAD(+) kinase [Salinisphaera sp.]